MSKCSHAGCEQDGSWHPVIMVYDGIEEAVKLTIKAVLCDHHKAMAVPADFIDRCDWAMLKKMYKIHHERATFGNWLSVHGHEVEQLAMEKVCDIPMSLDEVTLGNT